MKQKLPLTPIHDVQGDGLMSPLANRPVRIRGVVTGRTRRGYFVQDPKRSPDDRCSDGIFVYSPRRKARTGTLVELLGKVVDYRRGETERPTTQIKPFEVRRISKRGPQIEPVWLTAELLHVSGSELAQRLNGLEGMLVGIPEGSTFAAASNSFGDYVCIPPGLEGLRADNGGMVIDPEQPERWLPGFRITRYDEAPCLNVGAKLLTPAVGPLNFRADAFQIALQGDIDVKHRKVVPHTFAEPNEDRLTIMTLNGFNLDVHVEDPQKVSNPDRDVDDDKLYGRFELLAEAIVKQACAPDIVALQEIQDNDGAEITDVVDASETYEQLIEDVRWQGGPTYRWADIPPAPEADGGQPGGNIRNAFLYNPDRVELVEESLRRIGEDDTAFEASRKPLFARFRFRGAEIDIVNVHLASKRHQAGLFAPDNPGHDPREPVRVAQARLVREALADARDRAIDYYITGDFNDFEFSATLRELCGDDGTNMVESLPPNARFDYNHRGQLQVLMHGIVPTRAFEAGAVDYQILHGNELIGVKPGSPSGKASDHAYVMASIRLGASG